MNKRLCKILLSIFIITWVMIIPVILFIIGSYKGGISLDLSNFQNYTFDSFINLFSKDEYSLNLFRLGFIRGLAYASITSILTSIITFYFIHWIATESKYKAKEMAFLFLTFALLPQTFYILPVKLLFSNSSEPIYSTLVILISLIIGILPLSIWISFFVYGEKIRKLILNYSIDLFDSKLISIISYKEIKSELLLTAGFSFIFAWGNYLIPFALGSNATNTALVTLTTFSSNLGRNWSMICAAGFIIIIPIFLMLFIMILINKNNK